VGEGARRQLREAEGVEAETEELAVFRVKVKVADLERERE